MGIIKQETNRTDLNRNESKQNQEQLFGPHRVQRNGMLLKISTRTPDLSSTNDTMRGSAERMVILANGDDDARSLLPDPLRFGIR